MAKEKISLSYCEETYPAGHMKVLYDDLNNVEGNLYIVSTPLQLLCAIEAQHHFKTQNNTLVILFFLIGNGKNIDQIFKMSELFPYNKLITYRQSNGINLKVFQRYINELSKYNYNYVFFGYGTPIYRRMIANIKYKSLYMVDDGIHSITVHKQLINQHHVLDNNFTLTKEAKSIRKKLRNIIYFTKGIRVDSDLKDLNFFTMFDLKYNKSITHDFSHVRNLFLKSNKVDERVYILGQPLKKAIEMDSKTYIYHINQILEKYTDKEFVYIPHRTENIGEELGYFLFTNKILILHINSPIEIFFMSHKINPELIFSFISSALFTIAKIFPESNPKYIEIDTSPYSDFHQENIQLIYDNYRKDCIEKFEPVKT